MDWNASPSEILCLIWAFFGMKEDKKTEDIPSL